MQAGHAYVPVGTGRLPYPYLPMRPEKKKSSTTLFWLRFFVCMDRGKPVVVVVVCSVACLPRVRVLSKSIACHRIASHRIPRKLGGGKRETAQKKKKLGIVTTAIIPSLCLSVFFLELRAGDDVMALLVASPRAATPALLVPPTRERRDIGRLGRKRHRFFVFYMLGGCRVWWCVWWLEWAFSERFLSDTPFASISLPDLMVTRFRIRGKAGVVRALFWEDKALVQWMSGGHV